MDMKKLVLIVMLLFVVGFVSAEENEFLLLLNRINAAYDDYEARLSELNVFDYLAIQILNYSVTIAEITFNEYILEHGEYPDEEEVRQLIKALIERCTLLLSSMEE